MKSLIVFLAAIAVANSFPIFDQIKEGAEEIGPEIVAALTYGFTYIWVKLVMLYTTMASLV